MYYSKYNLKKNMILNDIEKLMKILTPLISIFSLFNKSLTISKLSFLTAKYNAVWYNYIKKISLKIDD